MTSKRATREWSTYQQAIFAFVATMATNLVILARAGCGKTTTIVESAARLPKGLKVIFCAFNKSIVAELVERLPAWVECKTLHAIGFMLIRFAFRSVKVDEHKGKDIARVILTEAGKINSETGKPEPSLVAKIVKLAGLGKNMMATDVDTVATIASDFGVADDSDNVTELATWAFEAMERAANMRNVIDFDDMIFFPWRHNLSCRPYDVVIVDECQDMNAAQLWLARRLMKPGTGRMIVVGDDRQAIYGWRGADADAMSRMTTELDATVLPLSVTYRCPKAIVAMANEVVADIQAAPTAPDGTVNVASASMLASDARPGDFILSRKNAPLMGLCLSYLARSIPAVIAGRDVGRMLGIMVEKSGAESIPALVTWVESYREREINRLSKLDPDKAERKVQEAHDKCDCILALTEGAESIREVYSRLDRMFSDDDPKSKIVLSTVHKAKGLERDRVWILSETFKRGKSTEEDNLWYVAVTRSKSELAIVNPG